VKRLRILALAPDANPESISTSLVCYRHAEALAQLHCVTLVIRSGNERAVSRAQAPFQAVEAISHPWLDRIVAWSLRRLFKNNRHNRAVTPFLYPFAIAFEWRAWRRLRNRIAHQHSYAKRFLLLNAELFNTSCRGANQWWLALASRV
jgi:hypothetical protein